MISGAPLGSAATMSTRASEAVEKIMPKINTVGGIENRKAVSQTEWLIARKKFLLEEKNFSKLRDELNLQRRKLPWVKVEKEYLFDGPRGKVPLADLFSGKSQLIIYHFIFGPGWQHGVRTLLLLGRPFRQREHSHWRARYGFAGRLPRPWTEIEPFKKRMGWKFR